MSSIRPDEPISVSVRTGARRHDVSPDFIRAKIADGTLPSVKIGGIVRVPVDALDALFAPAGSTSERGEL